MRHHFQRPEHRKSTTTTQPASERIKKDLTKQFASLGLRITIDTNLKVANSLDLTLNLRTGKYQPYRKPNDEPVYVHKSSNHPPSILRSIPASVSRRIRDNSSDRRSFDEAAPSYNAALKASGYKDCIDFIEQRKHENSKNADGLGVSSGSTHPTAEP